jgi:Rod binding domain-containing protein
MVPIDSSAIPAGAMPGATLSTPTSTPALGSADEAKLKKAAGDFESILLASMWKGMKQSFGSSETDADPAHGTLDDWGIEIMSGAVGRAGGLGIAKLLLAHLDPAQKGGASAAPVDGQAEAGKITE